MLKFKLGISPSQVKQAIGQIYTNFHNMGSYTGLYIYYDVDPV